jgi:hypothetical protein
MSPLSAVSALFVVVALLALAWWIRARLRALRDPGRDAERRFAAAKFDTTMGELRDMREALRPVARAPAKPQRFGRAEQQDRPPQHTPSAKPR